MKKEIEYRQRVYSKGKFDHFHHWGMIDLVGDGQKQWVGPLTFKFGVTDPNDSEQFTGLYDKNGLKIFEGDVEVSHGVCKWNKHSASFVWDYVEHDCLDMGDEEKWCTVTGNIHEK